MLEINPHTQLTALHILELFTVLFGGFCVFISVVLAMRFRRVKQKLSRALSLQLLGEAIVGLVTVIFACTSWLGLYKNLAPEFVLLLRLVIFSVAAITSINLYRRVKELE